jgi:hypothetical protein
LKFHWRIVVVYLVVVDEVKLDASRTTNSRVVDMAEHTQSQVLEKIRQYATESRRVQEQKMDVDVSDQAALDTRLDRTIHELQERLKKQQSQLEKVGRDSLTLVLC